MKNNNRYMLVLGIIFMIVILIASTYAAYRYLEIGNAAYLTSNNVTASFSAGSNHINFSNAVPLSDSYALSHLDSLNYTDFTVSSNVLKEGEAVTYEIYLTEKDGNTLDNRYVKVYLTDGENNMVAGPSLYSSLGYTTYNTDSNNGRVVYSNRIVGNFSRSYRLYAWLDSGYSENAVNSFDFYLNLYAYNS